jgi:membrane protein involved in colicin uptake
MKRQWLKHSSVLFVVILFSLMSGIALAEKKNWFVVKDKDGMCRVIEAQKVAGPFKTMEEAEKRKAKDCPKGAGQTTDQLRTPQEQVEPVRRQHQQREEPRQQHLKQTPQQEQQTPQQRQLKQQQTPQQQQKLAPKEQQQTEKIKGKAQEKIEGTKPTEEKVKEGNKEPIPSDKKN